MNTRSLNRLLYPTILVLTLSVTGPRNLTAQDNDVPGELLLPARSNAQVPLPAHAAARQAHLVIVNRQALEQARMNLAFFDGRRAVAVRDRMEKLGNGDLVWVGRLDGEPLSRVSIASRNGTVAGVIDRPTSEGNELLEIHPVAPGISVLFRVDEGLLPPCAPLGSVDDQDQRPQAQNQPALEASASTVPINLMVVYTPASAAKNGGTTGIEAKILQAVADANTGYLNSGIGLQMNLIYQGQVDYVETGHMEDALTSLLGNKVVADLRWQNNADLVALIDEDPDYCGDAAMIRPLTKPQAEYYAFCVVYSACLSSLTLPHELGHLQGCHHNREDALDVNGNLQVGAFPYAYGWRFCGSRKTPGYRTVMCYACSWSTRINYFSNPGVLYNGYPTGVDPNAANAADNALCMINTAPIVADFHNHIGPNFPPPPQAPPAPAVPSSLVATPVSTGQINLKWVDGANDYLGFLVGRSTDRTKWTEKDIGRTLYYSDTSCSLNTLYYYRVRAYYQDPKSGLWSNSDYSNIASAKTKRR